MEYDHVRFQSNYSKKKRLNAELEGQDSILAHFLLTTFLQHIKTFLSLVSLFEELDDIFK